MFKFKLIRQEELARINQDLRIAKELVETLQASLKEKKKVEIDVNSSDPLFKKSQDRVDYIARVSGFFSDVLEKKLKVMIKTSSELMVDNSNTRETDLYLKGAIYALNELVVWGNELRNEYSGFLVESKNQAENKSGKTDSTIETIQNLLV